VSGWSKELYNDNLVPLTYEQERLRDKVQPWLAGLYKLGATTIDFVMVGDAFPNADYADLMRVYDDLHRNGFLEEHVRR
jgi:hypothetical protein